MATVLKPEPEPAPAGFKAYRRGTHRTVDPATTLARVQPYLARMGITRIANVTGLDRIGVQLYTVRDRMQHDVPGDVELEARREPDRCGHRHGDDARSGTRVHDPR
jgi:hypothetical protein